MNKRDQVARLAKTDFAAALKLAESIGNLRERIQSLGWVARYAPADRIQSTVNRAFESTGSSEDLYSEVMGLAWPLRAMQETGHSKLIPPLLDQAVELAKKVTPNSSRAEALRLLIHAVLPVGPDAALPAVSSLTSLDSDPHWRIARAFIDVALLLNGFDRECALEVATCIPVPNKAKSTMLRIENGEQTEPRPFFW